MIKGAVATVNSSLNQVILEVICACLNEVKVFDNVFHFNTTLLIDADRKNEYVFHHLQSTFEALGKGLIAS